MSGRGQGPRPGKGGGTFDADLPAALHQYDFGPGLWHVHRVSGAETQCVLAAFGCVAGLQGWSGNVCPARTGPLEGPEFTSEERRALCGKFSGQNRDSGGAHRTPCVRRANRWGVCWCLLPAAACRFVYLSVLPVTDLWGRSRSAIFYAATRISDAVPRAVRMSP